MTKSLTLRSAKNLVKYAQRYLEHGFETVPSGE